MLRLSCLLLCLAICAFAQDKTARTDRGKATPVAKPAPPRAEERPLAATPAPPVPAPMPAGPDAVPPEDAPGRMVTDFFNLIAQGKLDEAYVNLTRGSKTMEKPEDARVLKQKTKEAIEVFGAFTGHELVESKAIGTRLLRRTYLSLGAEFPLRWRFYFYKANERWRLIDLRVDDRLAGMFDEPKDLPDDGKVDRP
jgi:hypothetical protein